MAAAQMPGKPPGATPSREDLRRSIAAAARVLAESQDGDGSFPLGETASQPPATVTDPLFSTAMVVGLAASVLPPACISRAAAHILARRDSRGLWAWIGDGTLPPDADDTACCLGALAGIGAPVDGAQDVRRLRRFWRWGGPFRTWMAGRPWNARDRDDPVVNCNVLWALGRLGAEIRPAEHRAVRRIIAAHRGPTRYYCSEASVAWAAGRVGIATPGLCPPPESVLAGRPLECALWSLALPSPIQPAGLLLEMQDADGGWKAEPWLQDHAGFWESRAVTIAFVIAALQRFTPDR